MLTPKVKKFLWITLVIFIVYSIVVSPNDAASMVRAALGKISSGLDSVGTFVNALMKR
jgi:cell shape-determining protein MreC